MKIPVKYNNAYYYWVNTVVIHEEYDYICAILVSGNGGVFPVCIDKIKVVDDGYDFEKNAQKRIDELKYENLQLNEQMRLDAAIGEMCNRRIKDAKR